MANRRMFSLDVIDTDTFLEMPASAQNLYFHLGMRADDDGFVSSPKKIAKMVNCGNDDLTILLSKGFLIPFDDGVVVIKHWKQNNRIRSDRYKGTIYQADLAMLTDSNGIYELDTNGIPTVYQNDTNGIPMVSKRDTQYRLVKDSIVKDSIGINNNNNINNKSNNTSNTVPEKRKIFKKPTVDEVRSYCSERRNSVDPQAFVDFYESKGWMIGKNPMKDWKAAVRTWEKNGRSGKKNSFDNFDQPVTDYDSLMVEQVKKRMAK